jgi:hypothetical protein
VLAGCGVFLLELKTVSEPSSKKSKSFIDSLPIPLLNVIRGRDSKVSTLESASPLQKQTPAAPPLVEVVELKALPPKRSKIPFAAGLALGFLVSALLVVAVWYGIFSRP